MSWYLLGAVVLFFAVLSFIAWRKWIGPWRRVERLIKLIARDEHPETFLLQGGAAVRRTGLALENLFDRQERLNAQIIEGESGTQTILSAMHDGLLVVDAQRRVTLANETFRKLFGLGFFSAGTPLLDIVRHSEVDGLIAQTLRTGQAQQHELGLPDAQSNSERRMQLSAVPTKDNRDGTTGAVILFHDITELKRVDQMRSDFVANVSHELRTPLSILRGYIETLLDHPRTSADELARILGVMERHSKRLGLLVEDLLTLAQLESPNPNLQLSNLRVDDLFFAVVRDWSKKLADKELSIVVDLPPDLPSIRGDETRLQEILYNLLDNAVKYSAPSGEIRLRAQRRDGEIALSVSDNGIGIGKDDVQRIFERFYRADKARSREMGGTGLGLSIVKHIVQLHGGRVEAESELARGTTITVLLPIGSKPAVAPVTQT
jgi:two-component system phosphate regulon sensor histidine kinase PhoR